MHIDDVSSYEKESNRSEVYSGDEEEGQIKVFSKEESAENDLLPLLTFGGSAAPSL